MYPTLISIFRWCEVKISILVTYNFVLFVHNLSFFKIGQCTMNVFIVLRLRISICEVLKELAEHSTSVVDEHESPIEKIGSGAMRSYMHVEMYCDCHGNCLIDVHQKSNVALGACY